MKFYNALNVSDLSCQLRVLVLNSVKQVYTVSVAALVIFSVEVMVPSFALYATSTTSNPVAWGRDYHHYCHFKELGQ